MPHPHLPQELLDNIINLLHDQPEALKESCLVAKSWIPRTRKHIFATVNFRSAKDLQSWKGAFPDPSKSPACYTRSMYLGFLEGVVAADATESGWLRAFSHLANLRLQSGYHMSLQSGRRVGFAKSFVPFYVFSPTIKSLRVPPALLQFPDIRTLIHSSPLLEDLTVMGYEEWNNDNDHIFKPQTTVSSTSPPFTGSLNIQTSGGMRKTARYLTELPNGLHFRSLTFLWDHPGDIRWMTELMERCSGTLECLHITRSLGTYPDSAPVNLSKVTRLKDVVFRRSSKSIEWIAAALQTITPEHRDLRQISIHVPYKFTLLEIGVETYRQEWSNIDRIVVQLWESLSARPRVGSREAVLRVEGLPVDIGDWIRDMLPEATKRGIVCSID